MSAVAKQTRQKASGCCSSSTQPINTVSNLVSTKRKSPTDSPLTKCPHVCLIGNISLDDLHTENLLQLKRAKHGGMETNEIEEHSPHAELKCDLCEQTKNLWLCLREDCLLIGCGGGSKDEASPRHSSLHAQNWHHPLAINLTTKAVWCELCNMKIILSQNSPPFHLKPRQAHQDLQLLTSAQRFDALMPRQSPGLCDAKFEDLELMAYLDEEINRKSRLAAAFGIGKTHDYDSEHDEDYFMRGDEYDDKATQNKRYGQIGLDNLGNTCFMNAALQSLSNCPAFASYFIECWDYMQTRLMQKSSHSEGAKAGASCLATSYGRLMKEMWEEPKQAKKKQSVKRSGSYTPTELVQTIKYMNPMFRGYMQHDSQEFLCFLMDQMHEELKRPIYTAKIDTNENEDEENKSNSSSDDRNADFEASSEQLEVDSGIHRLSIKSSTQTLLSRAHDGDDDSADSFETCAANNEEDEEEPDESNRSIRETRWQESTSDMCDTYSDATEDTTVGNTTSPSLSLDQSKRFKRKHEAEAGHTSQPFYSSIVSDLFEGKLIGQVQCLECMHLSTTTEPFQHLSLPIQTREYTQQQMSTQVNKNVVQLQSQAANQGWIGWMVDIMKSYLWTPTITLQDCLNAFFSNDDLKGDNMYSCEKCKKLTNGIKYSKLLQLPEIMIIHLKRFRHDSMFSAGKIGSYVCFPLDELEMRPYLHETPANANSVSQYELCSIICHYGGSNGGHYIAYARNCLDEEWYEFDDSYCRRVDPLTIQNAQAYVLFYRKKSNRMDDIKEELRSLIQARTLLNAENSLLQSNYISKQWLHKLKHFSEPGPIDNSDFLCRHNFVQPNLWRQIDNLAVRCSADTWLFLLKTFDIKKPEQPQDELDTNFGTCNYLYPCRQCQIDDEIMKQRQNFEKNEFLRLSDKSRLSQLFKNSTNPYKSYAASPMQIRDYAISSAWFKQWEQFVQLKMCPRPHQIPGKINNISICVQSELKNDVHLLNKNANYYKISEEIWQFLLGIYGGGPALAINWPNTHLTRPIRTKSTSSTSSSNPGSVSNSHIASYLNNKMSTTSTTATNSSVLSTSHKILLQPHETQI